MYFGFFVSVFKSSFDNNKSLVIKEEAENGACPDEQEGFNEPIPVF
jgi:hypothetical protein